MATIFKRDPIEKSGFITALKSRSKLFKQNHTGDQSSHFINPAYVILTGICNKCDKESTYTLPVDKSTWELTYNNGTYPPIIESVKLSYGGDHGMTQALEATIRCFDYESFERVTNNFLLAGNDVNITFGNSTNTNNYNSGEQQSVTLEKFRVATFSFSTEGAEWVGKFTAIATAEGLKAIDMGMPPDIQVFYKKAGKQENETEGIRATSIAEVVEADAQRDGEKSENIFKEDYTGYVLSDFDNYTKEDYKKTPSENLMSPNAAMVIYTSKHLEKDTESVRREKIIGGWGGGSYTPKNSSNTSENEIYMTLGYIVDRLINQGIIRSYKKAIDQDSKDYNTFKDLRIGFHKDFSYTELISKPFQLQSGDPTSVLILDDGIMGNFSVGTRLGMNFNNLKPIEGSKKHNVIANELIFGINLSKILINKRVLINALNSSTQEPINESTNVDQADQQDKVIDVTSFFRKLFGTIKECTGGMVSLTLSYDVGENDSNTLYIVDQNYAGLDPLKCFVFDPIKGDGNVIDASISSNGGSKEYRTSMYLNVAKKSTIINKLRECESKQEEGIKNLYEKLDLVNQYNDLTQATISNQLSPLLVSEKFNGVTISKFKSLMNTLYNMTLGSQSKFNNINFPAIELSLTIKGTWGIITGNAVATTHIPMSWLKKGIYFTVTEVTHNFQNSQWTTDIRAILTFHNNLEIIEVTKL